MEDAIIQQIKKKIVRRQFGEIFFVSSFPRYDVEYETDTIEHDLLLAPAWMQQVIKKGIKQ